VVREAAEVVTVETVEEEELVKETTAEDVALAWLALRTWL